MCGATVSNIKQREGHAKHVCVAVSVSSACVQQLVTGGNRSWAMETITSDLIGWAVVSTSSKGSFIFSPQT